MDRITVTVDNIRRDYYVYALIDPRNGQPFYIGKGKGPRVKEHYMPFSLRRRLPKNSIIKAYRELGFSDEYKIYQSGLTNDQALLLEEKYIKLFGRKLFEGGCLANINPFGNDPTSIPRTKEWADKISKTKKSKPFYHDRDTVEKINSTWRGQKHTTESLKIIKEHSKFRYINDPSVIKNLDKGRLVAAKWFKVEVTTKNITFIVFNLKEFCILENLKYDTVRQSTHIKNSYKEYKITKYIPTEEELKEYERSGSPKSYQKIWVSKESC